MKVIKIMWELVILLFFIIILSSVIIRVYEYFKVINNIKQPSKCLQINESYYCKVGD